MINVLQIRNLHLAAQYKKPKNANQNPKQMCLSKISFKGIDQFSDYQIKQIKDSKQALSDEIATVFKNDREIIDDAFTGIVETRDKFSKLGYYLSLKDKANGNLYQYLQNQNLRKLNKEYNDFYNTNLKSYSTVVDGQKRYLNESLNSSLKKCDSEYHIEKAFDAFFQNKMILEKDAAKFENYDYLHSDFAQKRLTEFTSLFKENPIMMTRENIHNVFNVINKQLDNANKVEFDTIYENLDNLSEALYTNNKNLMLDAWRKLTKSTVDFYKTGYLVAVVKDKDEKVKKLGDFFRSDNYKILNQNKKLSLLFEYRGSGELSLSEKAFLIDKYNQAQQDKKSYGIDMLDFLVNKPANNKIRKQIVKNLVESQEFAQNNFDDLKKLFVQELNNKNYDANVFNIKINQTNIIDLVLFDMEIEPYLLSDKEKLNYLATIADEDIERTIEKHRKDWIDEKFVETLNFESDKYDMSKQTDYLVSRLTVNHDGKDIPINEFLENSFKTIFGQNADLMSINKIILEYEKANNKNLQGLFVQNKAQYDAIMGQMSSLMQTLSQHDAKSEAFFKHISKELDKIEMNCPWLKPQVKDTRSTLEKIKDGVFNPRTLMSGGLAISSIMGVSKTLTASGSPSLMTLGVIAMFLCHAINAHHGFKNAYNKKGI